MAAILFMGPASYAATMGHPRLLSSVGQPLRIDVPVTLAADEVGSLTVSVAPSSAWNQAGLRPPVDPATLHISVVKGYGRNTQLIRLSSGQPFDQPVADMLLDIRTSSGRQRYQTSLLAYGGQASNQDAAVAGQTPASAARSGTAAQTGGKRIRVRDGDTMFAIAERNAVSDVTVFQMMIALQRANPRAFIEGNLHLVKAGATLVMPDKAALTAISDSEARRIYQRHVQAFALYRQRLAGGAPVLAPTGDGAQGVVGPAGGELALPETPAPRDQLRLSGVTAGKSGNSASVPGTSGTVTDAPTGSDAVGSGNGQSPSSQARSPAASGSQGAGSQPSEDVKADDALAAQKSIGESSERVSTLEENVKHLNEALRAQGEAAKDLVVDGAIELGRSLAGAASAVTDAASSIIGGHSQTAVDPAGTDTATAASEAATAAAAADEVGGTGVGRNDAPATGASPVAPSPGSGPAISSAPGVQAKKGSGQAQGQAEVAQAGQAGVAALGGTPSGTSPNAVKSDVAKSDVAKSAAGGTSNNQAVGRDSPSNVTGNRNGNPAAGDRAAGVKSAQDATIPAGEGQSNASPPNAPNTVANAGTAAAPAAGAGATSAGSPAGPAVSRPAPSVAKAGGSNAPESGALPTVGAKPDRSANNRAERTGPETAVQPNNQASVSPPLENKADQIVNWIQENTLGVLTALLTLIILAIVWLLRRANAARRDGEGHGGRITEAMVQEKLDAISLDLGRHPAEETGPRS
jgi:pilus assembly protein FimV